MEGEKMRLYRIYTENVNPELTKKLIDKYLTGYTIYQACGCWAGVQEQSIVIEYLSRDNREINTIVSLCEEIKQLNKQQAVIFTVQDVTINTI
jgi:hypothetical protein